MIELEECIDRCFLDRAGKCTVLKEMAEECNYTCPFYKPKGCGDWVRMKHHGHEVICPPEEYERRFKAVHWRIKVLPKSKE